MTRNLMLSTRYHLPLNETRWVLTPTILGVEHQLVQRTPLGQVLVLSVEGIALLVIKPLRWSHLQTSETC